MAQASGLALGQIIIATLDSARDFDLTGTVTVETLIRPELDAPSPVTVVVAPNDIQTTAQVIVTYGCSARLQFGALSPFFCP